MNAQVPVGGSRPTRESYDRIVGRRVHQIMWEQRLTQTTLAKQIGLDQSSLGKRLRGDRGWSLDEVHAVAAALRTTVAYLFGEDSDPHTDVASYPPRHQDRPVAGQPIADLDLYRHADELSLDFA
jgi:transcriptional regulator with XRE-family HTH domain